MKAYCLECSLRAGAPVLAGLASPGHAYRCGKAAADPNDAVAVAAAATGCPCCLDPSHRFVEARKQ